MDNYNRYQLENVEGNGISFEDNSVVDIERETQVYFRNIEKHLLRHIEEANVVLGCVAWLTSEPILEKLASKDYISIIVQKEDFLRPDIDSGNRNTWKKWLQEKYMSLQSGLDRFMFDNILRSVSYCADYSIEAIRCVGNYNRDKKPAFPRMHNKFLIFAKIVEADDDSWGRVIPYGVWTGSFNLTKNATYSFENAIYTTDSEIVRAYYNEYGQIASMSEPLNWESDWIEPEWRIGS